MNASANPTTLLWALDQRDPPAADTDWIARVRLGDETAARALIRHLYPTVIQWVRICSSDPSCEEDFTRRVMLCLLRNPGRRKHYSSLEHWASGCTVRICLQQDRRRGKPVSRKGWDLNTDEKALLGRLSSSSDTWPSAGDPLARGLLEKVLVGLRPDQRLVLKLFRVEGWSYQEISQWTGWPVWLVWWKLRCARRSVRAQWRIWIEESN